jgi:NADPH-dependent glutamate synthase beta subunit-like oxidoreductase
MFEAILMMGGLGIAVGTGLAVASKVFYVWVDPRVEAVDAVLPGANCGGCGLPGCSANAEAIVAGKAAPNSCVAAGDETTEAIAAVLGVTIEAKEPDFARPGCYFGTDDADLKYIYNGLSDCRAAALLNGGMKVCTIGCLGLGSCADACPFGAIVMGPEGLPVVLDDKCTGCGTCERVCPKHIITLSSVTRRILKEYTTDECTTPCQRRCPAGIDIREYIRQITLGDYHRSVQVIKERNPFPAVIGRICPRPCEEDCRRQLVDEPVGINYLKRFAADYERESGERIQPYRAPASGRKLAVVGGGAEGLSTAFFSARLGHTPWLYEATGRLGGLLRSAIAKERLPEAVLDWDIQGVLDMGVIARTGMSLGKEITLDSLFAEGHEAVFLASGGWDSRLTRMSGDGVEEPVKGIYLMIDLIKSDTGRSNRIPVRDDVVLLGGGLSGLRAARICADLGCENVLLIFREAEADLFKKDSELAELKALVEDGVKVVFNAAVNALYGEGDRLTHVTYLSMDRGVETRVAAENLFLAAGRFPELIFVKNDPEIQTEAAESLTGSVRWRAVPPYKNPAYAGEQGLLSPGDVLTDFSAAIRAIGAGRRAAASIHQLMYGISLELPEHVLTPDDVILDVDHVEQVGKTRRQIMPLCSSRERGRCDELELGYDEEKAQREAARCLQCGLICYERSTGETVHSLEEVSHVEETKTVA